MSLELDSSMDQKFVSDHNLEEFINRWTRARQKGHQMNNDDDESYGGTNNTRQDKTLLPTGYLMVSVSLCPSIKGNVPEESHQLEGREIGSGLSGGSRRTINSNDLHLDWF